MNCIGGENNCLPGKNLCTWEAISVCTSFLLDYVLVSWYSIRVCIPYEHKHIPYILKGKIIIFYSSYVWKPPRDNRKRVLRNKEFWWFCWKIMIFENVGAKLILYFLRENKIKIRGKYTLPTCDLGQLYIAYTWFEN